MKAYEVPIYVTVDAPSAQDALRFVDDCLAGSEYWGEGSVVENANLLLVQVPRDPGDVKEVEADE